MSFVAAAIGAAGAVGSAVISSNAAGNAAEVSAAAAKKANKKQRLLYQAQKGEIQPWMQGGLSAFREMGADDFKRDFTAADFERDPGYEFRMAEGAKALERSAAARGGLRSGGTLKSLSRYNQDFASNEFEKGYNRFNADRDRRFGRLSAMAGYGERATNQLGALRQNYANAYGNNLMGAAKSQGEAGMAQANAWGGALSSIGQTGMDISSMNWMDRQRQASGGSGMNGGSAGGSGNYGGYA